jgi:hypothetical protein
MTDDKSIVGYLETLGEPQVRRLMSDGGMPPNTHSAALRWLSEIDRESERIREASQAEQLEIARSAKDAAWAAARAAERANTRATIAIVIAIASAIIAIVIPWSFH